MIKREINTHPWYIFNLSLFILGWIRIYDSFKIKSSVNFYVGMLLVILIGISIFYEHKVRND
jgi:hypothetical protein